MINRHTFVLTMFGMLALCSASRAQTDVSGGPGISSDIVSGASEQQDTQVRSEYQLQLDLLVAPIKSSADLAEYLQNTPVGQSPLDKLPPEARARFLSSLVFGPKGLGGLNTGVLKENLTAFDIYHILQLFGLQSGLSQISGVTVRTDLDRLALASAPLNCAPDFVAEEPFSKKTDVTMQPNACWHEGYICTGTASHTCHAATPDVSCAPGC